MINDILRAITRKLEKYFGYKIYVNRVEQDFITPAFYVKCIDFQIQRLLTNERKPYHNKNNFSFSITYFPSTEDLDTANEDINDKIPVILEILDVIRADICRLRLKDSKVTVVDDTLIITVNYSVNTYKYIDILEDDTEDDEEVNSETKIGKMENLFRELEIEE